MGRPNPANIVNFEEATGKPRPSAPGSTDDLAAFYAQMRADRSFRFNWQTPFIVSPHNGRTIYLGGNRLFKSVDGGASWRIISPDLSNNDPETTRTRYRRPDARRDRGRNTRHDCLALGIAAGPGARVGGDRRRQRVGDEE